MSAPSVKIPEKYPGTATTSGKMSATCVKPIVKKFSALVRFMTAHQFW